MDDNLNAIHKGIALHKIKTHFKIYYESAFGSAAPLCAASKGVFTPIVPSPPNVQSPGGKSLFAPTSFGHFS